MRQGKNKAMYVSGNAQLGYVEIVVTRVEDGYVAEEFEFDPIERRTSSRGTKNLDTSKDTYDYLKTFFLSFESQEKKVLEELEGLEIENN